MEEKKLMMQFIKNFSIELFIKDLYPNFNVELYSTTPDEGLSKPSSIERIVLLPQPLGPTIATNSPSLRLKEKLSTAENSFSLVW